ncbi:hypothetical protein SynPROS91_01214 [Synechococcus sp. PROS-9-1]|nr:hypothetical protein SynPROS91_01214 [Synechococcus sp. PROS-9-1]
MIGEELRLKPCVWPGNVHFCSSLQRRSLRSHIDLFIELDKQSCFLHDT